MNHHLHIARFSSIIGPGDQPAWAMPDSVRGVIDLVPPQLDADPEVNYAIVASDQQLDSENDLHYFGEGDPCDVLLSGADIDAWEQIVGWRPTNGLPLADAIAEQLTHGSRPTGDLLPKPLIPSNGRTLTIELAGETIWQHTLASTSDTLYPFVLAGELQSLREINQQAGETAYRQALWVLEQRRQLARPAREYLPEGDELLPWLESLRPSTTKTENWPNDGTYTAGFSQNNSWEVITTGATVGGSVVTGNGSLTYAIRLDYSFGGSDLTATIVVKADSSSGWSQGPCVRMADANNWYSALQYNRASGEITLWKRVSGSWTQLGLVVSHVGTLVNKVLGTRATGSTIEMLLDGSSVRSATDTALSSGVRVGYYVNGNTFTAGQFIGDDGISAAAAKLLALLGVG